MVDQIDVPTVAHDVRLLRLFAEKSRDAVFNDHGAEATSLRNGVPQWITRHEILCLGHYTALDVVATWLFEEVSIETAT